MSGGNEQALNPKKPVTFTMDSYGGVLSKKKVNAEKFPEMMTDPIDIHVTNDKVPKSKKRKDNKGMLSGETVLTP